MGYCFWCGVYRELRVGVMCARCRDDWALRSRAEPDLGFHRQPESG